MGVTNGKRARLKITYLLAVLIAVMFVITVALTFALLTAGNYEYLRNTSYLYSN